MFRSSKIPQFESIAINIDNSKIEQVVSTKFLGVKTIKHILGRNTVIDQAQYN